jgi:hypothetical protein
MVFAGHTFPLASQQTLSQNLSLPPENPSCTTLAAIVLQQSMTTAAAGGY